LSTVCNSEISQSTPVIARSCRNETQESQTFSHATPSNQNKNVKFLLSSIYTMQASLLGALGASLSLVLSTIGAAFSTVKASQFTAALPEDATVKEIATSFLGTFFSGVLAIYGLIIAVLIAPMLDGVENDSALGHRLFAAGLINGGSCMISGICLGQMLQVFANAEATGKGRKNLVAFIFMMIFMEAFGLYGLISALVLVNKSPQNYFIF